MTGRDARASHVEFLRNGGSRTTHTEYYVPYDNKTEFDIIVDRLEELGYCFIKDLGEKPSNFRNYIQNNNHVVINSRHSRILFGHPDNFRKEHVEAVVLNPMGLFTEEYTNLLKREDGKINKKV